MVHQAGTNHTLFFSFQFGRDDDGFLSKKLCGERKLVPIYDYPGERPIIDSQNSEEEVHHNYVESLIPEGPEATTFYDPGGELHIWFRKTSRKVDQHLQPLRLKVIITAYRQSNCCSLTIIFLVLPNCLFIIVFPCVLPCPACKTNDTLYWPCTPSIDKTAKVQEKCIPLSLKCDGHVNCGAGLFSDETGCAVATSSEST